MHQVYVVLDENTHCTKVKKCVVTWSGYISVEE